MQRKYVSTATAKILRNWNPIRTAKDVAIKVDCKIHKDGSVSDVHIIEHTEETANANEQRAVTAIKDSAPFELPPRSLGDPIDLHLTLECPNYLNLSVAQALRLYGPVSRAKLRRSCVSAGIAYPPKRLTLVALKVERKLLMFGGDERLVLLDTFPLVSYSGGLGPKLREGDLQIPEGIYAVTGANARKMLSLSVNYPNALDRRNALAEHRTKLGTDILIHGGSFSTGCLVVSNEQMEEVLVAASDLGFKNVRLVIAPCDLTKTAPPLDFSKQPKWLPHLYALLKSELSSLPRR